MKSLLARLLVVSLLTALSLLASSPAFAQEGGEGEGEAGHSGIDFVGGPDWDSAREVTVWSIAGVAVFATVLGVLYLFKRKVGGFPEHPTWVAPISIMPAGELPQDDTDSGHEDHLGHDPHGGHAPAH